MTRRRRAPAPRFSQADLFADLIVDVFAGGGGASHGIERAMRRPVNIGLNHDLDALRNHAFNHPLTRHLREDIREVDPRAATGGRPVDLLWASPDCRHFSRAKGGKPCHPEVRMLKPSELKLAQGFPPTYRLEGTQKLQVRLIGNSVPPQLAEAVVRANCMSPWAERAPA